MAVESIQHQSYLLRLWPTEGDSELRAALISVRDPDDCHHFATIDELSTFLKNATIAKEEDLTEKEEEDIWMGQYAKAQ